MIFQYLAAQIIERATDFFRRWYFDASRRWWAGLLERLAAIDRTFAIRINFRMLFQPLYGDYTVVGRIIGPVFRFFRILIGISIYLFIFLLVFILWFTWIAIPAFIIYKIFA